MPRGDGSTGVELPDPKRLLVVIEKVGAMPKQGVASVFTFGYGFGVWIGALAALEIPYQLVTPQAWKKLLMAGEPKEKDASRVVARRMWPSQTEESLSRKKDHGRADAALLAEYGRRTGK
jgi:crossover junction endodeoxyribonuclease RuvC